MKNLKKVISILLVMGMMVTMFAGCGKEELPVGTTNEGSVVTKKTKISFAFWEAGIDQEQEKALNKIIEEYKKVQPNIEIELMSQPYNGYQEWLKARFLSNEAPDIISNHTTEIEKLYKQNYLLDFKEDLNGKTAYFDNKIWKDTFMDGKLEVAHCNSYEPSFAIPYYGMGLAYFYNKDLYKKFNLEVPKTWDQLMANCEIIQQNNVNPIALMLMKRDSLLWMSWYLTCGLFGNKYLADENLNPNKDKVIHDLEFARAIDTGKFTVLEGENNQILNKYFDMAEEYSKYCQGASGLDEAGAKSQFLAGKAAHLMSGSWDLKAFLTNKDNGFEIGTFTLPQFTNKNSEYAGENLTISTVQALAISNGTNKDEDKKKASVDFLKFLTSKDMYKIFIEDTFSIPTIKDVDLAPEFLAFTGGSVEPITMFLANCKTLKWNFESATTACLTGEKFDRATVIPELEKCLKEYSKEVMQKNNVSAENNYGVNELPVQGKFVPTKPAE